MKTCNEAVEQCGVKAVQKRETAAVCTGDAETLGACSDDYICNIAAELYGGKKRWQSCRPYELCGNGPRVAEAKKRGLSCGIETCSNDPKFCDAKQLCDKSVFTANGKIIWGLYTEPLYVKEAKQRGLTCGVVKEKTCLEDWTKCSNAELCIYGTEKTFNNRVWTTKKYFFSKFATEAKSRGLNCGVKKQTAINDCGLNPKSCDNSSVCVSATYTINGKTDWKQGRYQKYVKEAKSRGLNCGVIKKIDKAVVETCNEAVKQCSAKELCDWASSGGKWKTTVSLQRYVLEAQKRGLTCGVGAFKADFKQAFISEPKLKRQQLQYALKKLDFYSYGIDGLYGKGTEAGLKKFVDWAGLEGISEHEVFRSLLARVSVPSSFTKKKISKQSLTLESKTKKSSQTKSNYLSEDAIIDGVLTIGCLAASGGIGLLFCP